MFAFVTIGLATCLLASMASANPESKAEADPQFWYPGFSGYQNFYQPYQPYYHQPLYHYYQPAYQYTHAYYPTAPYVASASVQTASEAEPVQQEVEQESPKKVVHPIRAIVPVFDTLRSGQVAFLRPQEVRPVQPEVDGTRIISYSNAASVPYTQAVLNRIPISYA